ncbi:MAG: hypothetical protein QM488_05725 [Rhizobiaceae bacterium]
MNRSTITWRLVIRTVCAMSLVLLSFAHRPVVTASQNNMSSVELAAYALPDETALSFCLFGDLDGETGVERPCEFCRVAGSILLPRPSEDMEPDGLPVSVVFVVSVNMHRACVGFPPAAPPRGPPIVRI